MEERTIRGYDRRMIDDVLTNGSTGGRDFPSVAKLREIAKPYVHISQANKACANASQSQSNKPKNLEQPQEERLLLPQGETGKGRAEINDRKKHPRLAGADLYVTRLGWNNNNVARPNPKQKFVKPPTRVLAPPSSSESEAAPPSLSSSTSSTCTLGATGSLYDKLCCHTPRTPSPVPESAPTIPRESIHASRPCYRCVSSMYAVGIERVLWTNEAGEWEGGKVGKFIDALDVEGDGAGCGGGPMGNGVFFTKHKVLMMRRTMGDRLD
jgi:hypothetical protein